MPAASKVIATALAEVGYLEKASNKNLDSKTANAGSANYTKYWRDMCPALQAEPWCDCFVDWCFEKTYGATEAMKLECGGTYCYYTPDSAKYYQNAGQWSTEPALGAQIFFKNDVRICHTGLVVSFTDDEVTTVEGNTSGGSGVVANGGGVFQKTYKRNNSRIAGYGIPAYTEASVTVTQFLNAVKSVVQYANKAKWKYGNSSAIPPCSDGKISCDRMTARALWNLGYTNQPKGGITVLNMETYLTSWGFKKITKQAELQKGDIVLFKQNGQSKPTAQWHTFVLTAYNAKTGICSKYDEGSQTRINAAQPFTSVPLNEWSGSRTFYCAFRLPSEAAPPKRLTPKGTRYTIASAINRGYCIDVYGASMNPKTNVQIWKKNGSGAQTFTIEAVGNYYRIVNVTSGLVLDVYAGQAKNKQNVWQYEYNGSKAQLWKMQKNPDGSVTFLSAIDSAYVLDVYAGKAVNGQNVNIYKSNGSKAQKFFLVSK